jgi:hypothetical protein
MAGRIFGSAANLGKSGAPTIAGFKVQTSIYGLPIPIVYGQARVAGNLIHKYPSTAIPQVSQGSRSKFVKVDQQVTGYLYTSPIVLALSEGPIVGIGKVWRDKDASVDYSVYSVAGWSLFLGSLTQIAWAWLTSNHPSDAFPYQLTAYVAHPSLELPNDVLSNYTWEVQGLLRYGGGFVDANPRDVVVDILTDPNHGCGFPSAQLDALTGYSQYCIAAGLFLSPVLDTKGPLVDQLNALFEATNSGPVWSDGTLKVVPYADQAITGNSVTYTPNVTPIYDLTDDDFIAPVGTDPIIITRKKAAECFNQVLVSFEDRALDYNPNVQEAKDQGSVDQFGLRPAPTLQLAAIKDATTARYVAQLQLQRELNVRNTYQFTLPMRYSLLEPMDLVTLTDAGLGLNHTTVRITMIEESDTGDLVFTAEDFPAGVASASRYGAPGAGGNIPANNIPPGPTTAEAIFEGPGPLLQSALEIWIAASGGANWGGCDVHFSSDNVTYTKVGSITKKGNFGVLTAALATAAPSPPNDTTHTLAVDLTSSGGALVAGSASDLAALVTLSIVENEYLAYQGASLTSAFHYNLTTLERGLFGSPIPASHAIGAVFVRCDGALLKVPYPQGVNGQVVYFKFPAFNVFGLALEDIGSVSAVSHTIGVNAVTAGSGGAVLPVPALSVVTADPSVSKTTVHVDCSAGSTPAASLTYALTSKVGNGAVVTLSSGVVSALPIDVVVTAHFSRATVLRLLITDPLFPLKTIAALMTISADGMDGSRQGNLGGSKVNEDTARDGTGGVPTKRGLIRNGAQYTDDGADFLIDPVLGRFTSSISGPTGVTSTVIERGGNKGDNALDSGFVAVAGAVDFVRGYTGKHLGNVPDDVSSDRRAATADQKTGGDRAKAGLNSSNMLVSGVDPVATGSDGRPNIESRTGAARQAATAKGTVGEDRSRMGEGGVPVAGASFSGVPVVDVTGTKTLIDTTAMQILSDLAIGGPGAGANAVRADSSVAFGASTKFPVNRHNEINPNAVSGTAVTFGVSYENVPEVRILPQIFTLPGASSTVDRKFEFSAQTVSITGYTPRAVMSTGATATAETENPASTLNGTPASTQVLTTTGMAAYWDLSHANTTSTTYTVTYDVTTGSSGGLLTVKLWKNTGTADNTNWSQVDNKTYDVSTTVTGETLSWTGAMALDWDLKITLTKSSGTFTVTAKACTYNLIVTGAETILTTAAGSALLGQAVEKS